MDDQFQDDIKEMKETGQIYQQIAERYGDRINVVFVDPRNTISIADYMFRQLRHKRIGFLTMLKNTFVGSRRGAVFLNGHWLNRTSNKNEDLIVNIQQELGVE